MGTWPEDESQVSLDEFKSPVRGVPAKLSRLARLNFVPTDEVAGHPRSDRHLGLEHLDSELDINYHT